MYAAFKETDKKRRRGCKGKVKTPLRSELAMVTHDVSVLVHSIGVLPVLIQILPIIIRIITLT